MSTVILSKSIEMIYLGNRNSIMPNNGFLLYFYTFFNVLEMYSPFIELVRYKKLFIPYI